MLETLKVLFFELLEQTPTAQYRYLYHQINLKNRLMGIIGARGVGKTTLMLQIIKNHLAEHLNETLYFSADHIFFTKSTLVEFVHEAYFHNKIHYFFIDEIHKYKNWDQELKNIYDSYPKVKVFFSGSSSLELVKGTYDLSRRAVLEHLHGLSFREYLNFSTGTHHEAISPKDILNHYREFDQAFLKIDHLKKYFNEYLKSGFYPFVFSDEEGYFQRINRIVDRTIYEDISSFYKLKTENLHLLKRILSYLATIPPGETNTNSIARYLSIDNKTAFHYLHILSESGLIHLIYSEAKGNQILRKIEKIFLNNTTLHFAMNEQLSSPIDRGTVRELFFIQHLKGSNTDVFYNAHGDFMAMNTIFEIGGKNKTAHQMRGAQGYLVKDDILISAPGMIPLFYFGFTY